MESDRALLLLYVWVKILEPRDLMILGWQRLFDKNEVSITLNRPKDFGLFLLSIETAKWRLASLPLGQPLRDLLVIKSGCLVWLGMLLTFVLHGLVFFCDCRHFPFSKLSTFLVTFC